MMDNEQQVAERNKQIAEGWQGDHDDGGSGEPLPRRQAAVDTLSAGGGWQTTKQVRRVNVREMDSEKTMRAVVARR